MKNFILKRKISIFFNCLDIAYQLYTPVGNGKENTILEISYKLVQMGWNTYCNLQFIDMYKYK